MIATTRATLQEDGPLLGDGLVVQGAQHADLAVGREQRGPVGAEVRRGRVGRRVVEIEAGEQLVRRVQLGTERQHREHVFHRREPTGRLAAEDGPWNRTAPDTGPAAEPEELADGRRPLPPTGWLLTADPRRRRGGASCRRGSTRSRAWPDDGDGWMHHREMTDDGPKLCRSENIIPFHAGLRALLTTGPLLDTASALLGEPAVLYKEKVNYKLPGGAGYAPHQDAPAYPFIDAHVSCMVAVDDATLENGCLEVVVGHAPRGAAHGRRRLHRSRRGRRRYEWKAGRGAGRLRRCGSTPGRRTAAGPNRSGASPAGRSTPPTTPLAEGDLRADYYAEKLARVRRRGRAGRRQVQVSLIGDFQGRAGLMTGHAASVDEVLALYERWGDDHYDEELSQLDHALQTAALAVAEGADDALVAAALLHDVGHLLELRRRRCRPRPDVDDDLGHEAVGAR